MAKKHTFPGVYIDSGAARFLVGGIQEPLPPNVVVPPATSFTISGQVTEDSVGKEAVTITFSSAGSAVTDGTGNYSKTVPRNWIGNTTPVAISGGTFVPTSRSYAAVVSNWTTQDFVYNGTGGFGPQPFRLIEGSIAHAISETPIVGHPVTFTQAGPVTDTSDANGLFQFIGGYAAGTLVPAPISTGTWTPTQTVVPADQADHTNYAFLFYGTGGFGPQPAPFTIEGTLFDYSSNLGYYELWSGWEVRWNYGSTFSDTNGRYSILVAPGFTGTVAFYDTWGTSAPASYSFVNVQANQPNTNFDIYGPTYLIGGTIWDNYTNTPWDNEPVEFQNYGPASLQTLTDADGKYSFQLPWDAIGQIQPLITGDGSLSPQSFYPVDVSTLSADELSYNFQYWFHPPPVFRILEGYVYDGLTLVPLSNVVIDISGVSTQNTDVTGYWSQAVPDGYTGRATAIDMTGTFDPEAHGYTNLGTNALGQDFYFYVPVGDGLCPIPGPDITPVSMSPNIVSASRNVVDTTQHLLWFIDESGPNVGYYDITYGTIAGYVDTTPDGQWGNSGIVYDPVSNKIAVTGYYAETLTIIDPVTKTVSATLPGPRNTSYHMLTLADNGTIFATSNRWVAPSPNATIYGYDLTVPCVASVRDQTVYTDSICWASNISRLVINSGGIGSPRFYLYDPVTGVFQASVSTNTTTFNYENGYLPQKGHLLLGFNSGQAVIAMDIINGINATVVHTFTGAPTRLSDFTVDTCNNRLFISDGNYAVYEYRLSDYAQINSFDDNGAGLNPTGLAHSRKSNLVYYENYNDLSIHSLQATTSGTSINEVVLKTVNGEVPLSPGLEFNLPAIGATSYDSLTAADETNGRFFQGNSLEASGKIVNLGAPYMAYMNVAYTAMYDDQGAIDFPGQVSIYTVLGTASNFVSYNSNGTTTDSYQLSAMIPTGVSYISFDINANTGGNFTSNPATSFARNFATIQYGSSPFA